MKAWKKRLSALLLAAMVMSLMCVGSFAAEVETYAEGGSSTADTLVSAFTAGFQGIVSDAMSMIGAAAPIAIGLAGSIFLAKKAMSWFKGMAK